MLLFCCLIQCTTDTQDPVDQRVVCEASGGSSPHYSQLLSIYSLGITSCTSAVIHTHARACGTLSYSHAVSKCHWHEDARHTATAFHPHLAPGRPPHPRPGLTYPARLKGWLTHTRPGPGGWQARRSSRVHAGSDEVEVFSLVHLITYFTSPHAMAWARRQRHSTNFSV